MKCYECKYFKRFKYGNGCQKDKKIILDCEKDKDCAQKQSAHDFVDSLFRGTYDY